jgi:hypothetical protein
MADMGAPVTVLLGRTYGDAQLAMLRHASKIPGLEAARLASTFAVRTLGGARVNRVYVAPGTGERSRPAYYLQAVLILARSLRKTPGADLQVHQIREDGTVEPLDVDALRHDGF